jgi:hypothetical protein
MNFDPRRRTLVAGGQATDPRAALVCDIAEQIYGPAWRFPISTEFAFGPHEVQDWLDGRAAVPDFLIAGLLRHVRIRAGGYAAVQSELVDETAIAPEGDYSFPDALARNARIMIRVCDPESMVYSAGRGEYCISDNPDGRNANAIASDEATTPALYLVHESDGDRAEPNAYREPRVDARGRI